LGHEGEVLDLGRRVRLFTRAQRLALVERDGGCAKCHAPPEHCEAHHIRWWENGGLTDLANGVMLCTRCHHDIHRQGWEILVNANHVDFIPPPTIDPTRQPIPGGLAAIDIGKPDPLAIAPLATDPEQPTHAQAENSAWESPAWENSAWESAVWENSAYNDPAWNDAVWDGFPPPGYPWDDSVDCDHPADTNHPANTNHPRNTSADNSEAALLAA